MNACPRSPLSLPRRLARVALILGVLEAAACGGDDSQSPGNQEEPVTAGCREGTLSQSPALYRVCFPAAWNGDLVVYAHGYVSADEPLAIPDDAVEGQPIEQIVNGLGYGYATTSYRANGLVADQAVTTWPSWSRRSAGALRPTRPASSLSACRRGVWSPP